MFTIRHVLQNLYYTFINVYKLLMKVFPKRSFGIFLMQY